MMNNIATIRIKNLRLRAFVGIKDEEINNRQDIIVNIVLRCDVADAIEENDIDFALNYRTICKAVIAKVENERFALLERMTHDMLMLVMGHAGVIDATVEIDKVGALRYADSVSMTLSGVRELPVVNGCVAEPTDSVLSFSL